MPNEWKVILRAADNLDFSENKKEQYIHLVTQIYSEKVVDAPSMSEHELYADFLNKQVFSDSRLVSFLEKAGVSQENVKPFREGKIDVDSLVSKWNQIQFTLDELIDLLMMLKLVRDYSMKSYNGRVESRHRLQKLVYLVNAQIRKEDNSRPQWQFEGELGMLDRTGYRYQFVKRSSGPFAEAAYEDKNRLFAWSLLDEPVVDNEGTGEVAEQNRRYGIELSAEGEIFTERFYNKIENSDSIVVQSWNIAQSEVIDMIATMTQSELTEHVDRIANSDMDTGGVYLSGPTRKFKKNDVKFLDQLVDRVEDIMSPSDSLQVVDARV